MSNIVQVYLDIAINNREMGRLVFKLYRDLFPDGVENFARICAGDTSQQIPTGHQDTPIWKVTKRTYDGCVCYRYRHNGYLMSGDIYANNGSDAGTIFGDMPIPAPDADRYIPHDMAGLLSLAPRAPDSQDPSSCAMYDSTFLITLAPPETKLQDRLNETQIAIGHLIQGHAILDAINEELSVKRSTLHSRTNIIIRESGVIPSTRSIFRQSSRT